MAIETIGVTPSPYDIQQAAIDDARERLLGAQQAAAAYLEMNPIDLRSRVELGQSLAVIAQAQGKDVGGLRTAMLDSVMQVSAPAPIVASTTVDRLLYGTPGDGKEADLSTQPGPADEQAIDAAGGEQPAPALPEAIRRAVQDPQSGTVDWSRIVDQRALLDRQGLAEQGVFLGAQPAGAPGRVSAWA